MTVCVYITHDKHDGKKILYPPVILADSVATFNGREALPVIVPTNACPSGHIPDSSVFLTRKLYIVNNSLALAFAGNGNEMFEILEFAKENNRLFDLAEKPILALQSLANEKPDKVWLLGAHCGIDGKVNYINITTATYKTPLLGLFSVSGSGTKSMLERIKQFESLYESTEFDGVPGINFAIETNAIRLAEEVAGDSGNWGGYIEHAWLDIDRRCWIRGPRTLHLVMRPIGTTNGAMVLEYYPRVVAYAADGDTGRILWGDLGGTKWHEWTMESLELEEISHKLSEKDEFWQLYAPDVVTITVVIDSGVSPMNLIVHVLERDSLACCKIKMEHGVFNVQIHPGLINHLTEVAAWQMKQATTAR